MTLAPSHSLHDTLRDYQREVVDQAWAHIADGAQRGMIVMATGTGKTTTALGWWGQHRRRTLWLAHRIELCEQARLTCERLFPEVRATRADATVWDLSGDFVVGQVQTCATPKRLAALALSGEWDAVVVDECAHVHHPKATSTGKEPKPTKCQYTDIVNALGGSPFVLGLTATPDRLDKRSVVGWFEDRIIASLDIRWAIEHGHLVPIRALTVRTDVDLDAVKTSHGDFAAGDLGRALSAADAPATGVAAWLEHASDRITLAFAPTIESSIEITDAFRAAGVAAAHLDGKTPDDERRRLIRDLGTGALRVLVNVGVTTEGTDIPAVSCVAMWRPTTSRSLATQMIGRGLRLADAKQDCVAEGTLVLTDIGLVPIEQITKHMRLWDGEEFVAHEGVVERGFRPVIEYAGLTATPDHKVWTTQGWLPFGECAVRGIAIAVVVDGTRIVRASEGRARSSTRAQGLDRMRRVRTAALAVLGGSPLRSIRMQSLFSTKIGTEVVGGQVLPSARALPQSDEYPLRRLRRAGDRVQIRRANSDGGLDRREPRYAPGIADRQGLQRRALRAWEPPTRITGAERCELPEEQGELRLSRLSPSASGDPVRRRDASKASSHRHDVGSDHRSVSVGVGQTQRRVWDVLNAGPRRRFSANGLLVSNCLVLDLVGVSRKHSLVLASDVLGLHRQLGYHENSLDVMAEERELFEAAQVAEQLACEAEWADPDTVIFGESNPLAPRREAKARHTWHHAPVAGALRRWTCTRATETVVLRPHPDGSRNWVAGIGTTVATALIIASGPRLAEVVVNAERWIDGNRPEGAWRKDPVTAKQRAALLRLGHPDDVIARLTKAQAGRLIGIGKAAQARTLVAAVRDSNSVYRAFDRLTPERVAELAAWGDLSVKALARACELDPASLTTDQTNTLQHRARLMLRVLEDRRAS